MKKNNFITIVLLVLSVVVTIFSGKIFKDFSDYEVEFDTSKTTSIEKFSKYSPNLKGTVGDSNIYVIDSGISGPSLMIIGGTHPNEPSGQLTATLLLENLQVTKGKVFIITEANKSAYTYSFPLEAAPMYYDINGRTFKYGTRATNTNQQWPNPDVYVHATSGQKLSSSDTRNLNRSYPGSVNGTYTERVAYAITQCIKENNITITIDLHEASPEYLTINAIVYHERAKDIAATAQFLMDMAGIAIKLEESPTNLHGLTHRELGDYTDSLVFLCETSNASQGKIRGAFTTELITTGEDKFYSAIAEADIDRSKRGETRLLYAPPVTIDERVARHIASILSIIRAYNENTQYGANPDGTGKLEYSLKSDKGIIGNYDNILEYGLKEFI